MGLRFAILTVSDRSARAERPDASGPALETAIISQGWSVQDRKIVPDERIAIIKALVEWVDGKEMDIILTTGGTGFSPRDITPEATLEVIDRQAPGIAEAMRSASMKVTPHAMLSRAVAGLRGQTLIINLPGSPKGAIENFEVLLPVLQHAIHLLREYPDAEAGHPLPGNPR